MGPLSSVDRSYQVNLHLQPICPPRQVVYWPLGGTSYQENIATQGQEEIFLPTRV